MNSQQKRFQNNMGYLVNLPHVIAHLRNKYFLLSVCSSELYLELLTPLLTIAVFYSRWGHWYVRLCDDDDDCLFGKNNCGFLQGFLCVAEEPSTFRIYH